MDFSFILSYIKKKNPFKNIVRRINGEEKSHILLFKSIFTIEKEHLKELIEYFLILDLVNKNNYNKFYFEETINVLHFDSITDYFIYIDSIIKELLKNNKIKQYPKYFSILLKELFQNEKIICHSYIIFNNNENEEENPLLDLLQDFLINKKLFLPLYNGKIFELDFELTEKLIDIHFKEHPIHNRGIYVYINQTPTKEIINQNLDEKSAIDFYFKIQKENLKTILTIPLLKEDELDDIFLKIIYSLLLNNILKLKGAENEDNFTLLSKTIIDNNYSSDSYESKKIIASLRKKEFNKIDNKFLFQSFEFMSYNLFKFLITSSMEFYFYNIDNINFAEKKYSDKLEKIFLKFKTHRDNLAFISFNNLINDITNPTYINDKNINIDFSFYNYTDSIKSLFIHSQNNYYDSIKTIKNCIVQSNKSKLLCQVIILDCLVKGIINKNLLMIMYDSFETEYFFSMGGIYSQRYCLHIPQKEHIHSQETITFDKNEYSKIIIGNSGVGKTYGFFNKKTYLKKFDLSYIDEIKFFEKILTKQLEFIEYLLGFNVSEEEVILIDEFNRSEVYEVIKKYISLFDLDKYNFTKNFLGIYVDNNFLIKFKDRIDKICNVKKIKLAQLDTVNNFPLLIKIYHFIENLKLISFKEEQEIIYLFLTPNISFHLIMNTVDRNIKQLDNFWARRFPFEYIDLGTPKFNKDEEIIYVTELNYFWDDIRNSINLHLKSLNIPQDKLIGYFWWTKEEIKEKFNNTSNIFVIKNTFLIQKLAYYIYYQVLKNGDEISLRLNEIDSNTEKIFKYRYFDDIIKNAKSVEDLFIFNLHINSIKELVNEDYFTMEL